MVYFFRCPQNVVYDPPWRLPDDSKVLGAPGFCEAPEQDFFYLSVVAYETENEETALKVVEEADIAFDSKSKIEGFVMGVGAVLTPTAPEPSDVEQRLAYFV